MLADGSGERPLGLEVAQLIAVAQWLRSQGGVAQVQVETNGIRNQVIAIAAAAIDPTLFSSIKINAGMKSLAFLLNTPVPIRSAPELFCLDLYKDFDIDILESLSYPVAITSVGEASAAGPGS